MSKAHSLEVLFEDQWIVVVNKPSGLLSVGFPGFRGKTAERILSDMHRGQGKVRVSAVHRLDRDTSGVMMFALSAEARERIMGEWQEIVSERVYRCVCLRAPGAEALPDEGTVNAPIAYNRADVGFVPRANDHKSLKDAEKAITHFKVLARGKERDLVECALDTGRKNQIRVHLSHLGHPIMGDETYATGGGAGTGFTDGERDSPATGRLALHARVLAFTHPFTGDQMRFEVPEPESFAKSVRVGGKPAKKAENPGSNGEIRGKREQTGRERGERAPMGGNRPREDSRGKRPPRERKERDIEDLTDLKPIPQRSRTRQARGESKFLPGGSKKK